MSGLEQGSTSALLLLGVLQDEVALGLENRHLGLCVISKAEIV
jgi:cobyrinic acid a,c-diamide synthase